MSVCVYVQAQFYFLENPRLLTHPHLHPPAWCCLLTHTQYIAAKDTRHIPHTASLTRSLAGLINCFFFPGAKLKFSAALLKLIRPHVYNFSPRQQVNRNSQLVNRKYAHTHTLTHARCRTHKLGRDKTFWSSLQKVCYKISIQTGRNISCFFRHIFVVFCFFFFINNAEPKRAEEGRDRGVGAGGDIPPFGGGD